MTIKTINIQLCYSSPSELYAEIDAIEINDSIPIAIIINAANQTPYDSVVIATAIKNNDVIKCRALSPEGTTPFVEGHVLSATIVYI